MSTENGENGRVDLLVRAGAVATMNPQREIIRDGAVAVTDGRIVAVDKAAALDVEAARTIDLPDGLLTPGLIDAHNHPQDYLLRGAIDDMANWVERIGNVVLPYEVGISAEESYVAARATFAEMLLHGTTCCCEPGGFNPDSIGQAAVDIGIRGVVARPAGDIQSPPPISLPVHDADTELALAVEVVNRWNGAAGGRIRARLGMALPWSMSDELCRGLVEQSQALGVGLVGHFHGRTPDDYDGGRNPQFARYAELGILSSDALLAHIGWLHEDDVALFAQEGAKAVHCPSQSMFGGSGWINKGVIPELVAAGVMVGLGSDAACVSRFLDLVRVAYLAACAHKDAHQNPLEIGAHKAFEMATIDGAHALSWADEIGSLEPGKRADLALFDTTGLEWQPHALENPVADLVYSASGRSAHTVVVDGEVVVDAGTLTTIDRDVLIGETNAATTAVFDRLGLSLRRQWPMR